MVSLKKILIAGLLTVVSLSVVSSALAKDEVRYTKFNIHGQSRDGHTAKASYANYTRPGGGHVIVPAGTKILIIKKARKKFIFTYDHGAKEVVFEYHAGRMGMDLDTYLDKITSPKPVSLDGLSKLDRKGIKEGQALVGMSRDGVMTALGYPATHRTPSLDATTWIYWTNRFGTIAVDFDAAGKVKAVRD